MAFDKLAAMKVSRAELGAAGASALLLILSFPNFEFYQLAWVALVPLLLAIANRPAPLKAFLLGWLTGSVFFYASCYWLTYSMIHYGGLPTVLAYLLLIPGALVVGIFPGLFALLLALSIRKWGHLAVLLAPIFTCVCGCIRNRCARSGSNQSVSSAWQSCRSCLSGRRGAAAKRADDSGQDNRRDR
jgi:apolipoprotein N-acyltransferase